MPQSSILSLQRNNFQSFNTRLDLNPSEDLHLRPTFPTAKPTDTPLTPCRRASSTALLLPPLGTAAPAGPRSDVGQRDSPPPLPPTLPRVSIPISRTHRFPFTRKPDMTQHQTHTQGNFFLPLLTFRGSGKWREKHISHIHTLPSGS